jgi:hypothetical protein
MVRYTCIALSVQYDDGSYEPLRSRHAMCFKIHAMELQLSVRPFYKEGF